MHQRMAMVSVRERVVASEFLHLFTSIHKMWAKPLAILELSLASFLCAFRELFLSVPAILIGSYELLQFSDVIVARTMLFNHPRRLSFEIATTGFVMT